MDWGIFILIGFPRMPVCCPYFPGILIEWRQYGRQHHDLRTGLITITHCDLRPTKAALIKTAIERIKTDFHPATELDSCETVRP